MKNSIKLQGIEFTLDHEGDLMVDFTDYDCGTMIVLDDRQTFELIKYLEDAQQYFKTKHGW